MFRTTKWLPIYDAPKKSDFLNSRFNFLMSYQQENVKQSYESALESERHKDERVMQAVSAELTKQKHDELVDEKLRQKLNVESVELRELKANLRYAQTSMELSSRKAEIDLNRRHAERARTLGRERAEAECRSQLEYTRTVRDAYRTKQQELRSTLLGQMAEHQAERCRLQQQVLVERERRNAAERQRQLEDDEKQREQLQKRLKTRDEMCKFMCQMAEQKAQTRIQTRDDGLKYYEHICAVEDARVKAKLDKWREITKQQERAAYVGAHVFAIEDGKRQRELLLLDLLQKEHKNKMDRDHREQLAKELEGRRQMKHDHYSSLAELEWKLEQNAQEKAIEAAQVRELSNLVDPKLEIERRRKEHEQRQGYGAFLIAMMADNRQKRVTLAEEHAQFVEQKAKAENERQQLLLEERIKLLQSVPPNALRYLRNGVLTHTDVEHLEGPSKQVASEICNKIKRA